MIRNRRFEQSIETLIETALRAGYAAVPKWRLQAWYAMTKLTATIVDDLRARAVEHDTVENPSDLVIFAFRERDENRDVLLVRADRLIGGVVDEGEEEARYEDEADEDVADVDEDDDGDDGEAWEGDLYEGEAEAE